MKSFRQIGELKLRAKYAVVLLMVLGCSTPKRPTVWSEPSPDVQWVTTGTLTSVIERAKIEERPVFMDFYADWCAPCKVMDQEVYALPEVYDYFNASFVNFKVNGERDNGPNLALIYEVRSYPTLIWVDHKGRVLVRKEGASYPTELKRLGRRALNIFEGT